MFFPTIATFDFLYARCFMKNLWIVLTFFSLFFLVSCVEDDEEIAAGEPCSVPDEEACSANGDAILVCSDSSWEQKKSCDTNYGEYCQMTANGKLGCGGSGNNHDTGDTNSGTSDTGDNTDSDNSNTAPAQPDNDADTSDTGKTDNDTPQTDNDSDNLSPDNDADTPQTDNDTTELDEDTANPDNEITDNDSTVIDDEDTTEPDDDDTTVIDDDSDVPQPADEDADEDTDEDANADEDAPDEDATPADPCNPNPCAGKPNSTEVCSITEDGENYTCECVEGYEWKDTSSSCEQTNESICNGFGEEAKWTEDNKCIKTTTDDCAAFTDEHAVWNGETSYNQEYDFDNNTWREIETTYNEDEGTCHFKCDTNYFWKDGSCVNPCEPENNPDNNPCAEKENTDEAHTCTPKDATKYECGCKVPYFWNGENCRLTLGNICTGQNECYDSNGTSSNIIECPVSSSGTCAATNNCDYNYFGQDTQYNNLCEEHDFVVKTASNGDKTIFDNNTGLEWTNLWQSVTYAKAKTKCDDLNYAEVTGWRLPTPQELLTLVDSSRYSPPFDFSSIWPDMTKMNNSLFGVQQSGNKYYLMDIYGQISFTTSGTFNVMCVRGKTLPGGSFSTTDDINFVTDSTTGLMWQKTPSNAMNWRMALAFCETSEDSGYTDWRLPTKNELASLLEHKDKTAAPFSNFPFKTSKTSLWTSTTSVGNKANANYVSTEYKTGTAAKNNNSTYRALCVRNAE